MGKALWCVMPLCALLATAPCTAVEFHAGAGVWDYEISGTVTDRGRTYDFERDLALEPGRRTALHVELDTGRGRWPDFVVGYARLGASGSNTDSQTLLPGPFGVTVTRTIAARADFDDYDVTARYPFDWGPVRVQAGLTAKRLRGVLVIDDSAEDQPSHQRYDQTVPQLHAQLRWHRGRWVTLTGVLQGISAGDARALEWRATAELRRFRPLTLEAGWQEKRYEFDVNGYGLDARIAGALLRAGVLFGGP